MDGTARKPKLTRRQALAQLGLSSAVAYIAPSVVHLDRSANAQISPTPCPPGKKGKGGSNCPPV